jgi:hypothetical protein
MVEGLGEGGGRRIRRALSCIFKAYMEFTVGKSVQIYSPGGLLILDTNPLTAGFIASHTQFDYKTPASRLCLESANVTN